MKEINTIVLALPKVKCLGSVIEFRPIIYCNLIYKCNTKLICFGLKKVLPQIIVDNQRAFIEGRFIAHKIMIRQNIARNYARKQSSPSVTIKIDIVDT